MNLTIFGVTGRTGLPLLHQALEAGHHITALVREPARLDIEHPNLVILQGDALNASDVSHAIAGADAVLSTLGHSRTTPDDMQTIATRHIIDAMQKHRVRRLISLTGAGVAAPQDKPKITDHLIKFVLKTLAPRVLKDAENHAELIKTSTLDWTIVRAPRLTQGNFTGKYRVGSVGENSGTQISRADVANFMLKQVTEPTYVGQSPLVSN